MDACEEAGRPSALAAEGQQTTASALRRRGRRRGRLADGRGGRRPDDLPQQQPHARAGDARRRARAVAQRLRRAAHRAGAPRRTSVHRQPDRRRHHPGQDRRDLGRRAAPALRLHRQPARGPDRPGPRGARRHGRLGGAARRSRRAGPARDLVARRQAAPPRAGPARPQAAAPRGGAGARARRGPVVAALEGRRAPRRGGPGLDPARPVPRPRGAAARRRGRPPGARRRDDGPDAAADRERHLDVRPEQDVLQRRRGAGRAVSTSACRTRTRPWSC